MQLGGNISEGNGSRVRVEINGQRAVFHRPHPESSTDKGDDKSVRRFLESAGGMMNYKGYIGKVEYDDENDIFTGSVINVRTVITFQGSTVDEIEKEFKASVDDYLNWCREDGTPAEKP